MASRREGVKVYKHNLRRNTALTGKRFLPAHLGFSGARPAKVDLRPLLPPVFDQGEEGSCGPNSADALMCFFFPEVAQLGGFSRQQIYYCVRQLEEDVLDDAGVETKDLFAILHDIGAAPESLWEYLPANFKTVPPAGVLLAANGYKISSYSQLTAEEDFLDCLAEGFPFILGFECYESIDSEHLAKTGVMPRPNVRKEKDVGGHDVLVVGYDTNFLKSHDFLKSGVASTLVSNTALLIRNSWGTDFGIQGHFWMPIDYASNAQTGGDCWTGRL